jgi:hypothetical protein
MLNEETVDVQGTKPNTLGIFGDDIERTNISVCTMGALDRTLNIAPIANEGTERRTVNVLRKDANHRLQS